MRQKEVFRRKGICECGEPIRIFSSVKGRKFRRMHIKNHDLCDGCFRALIDKIKNDEDQYGVRA